MCCKGKFSKIFAAFLIALSVVAFTVTSQNNTVENNLFQSSAPITYHVTDVSGASDPLAYLFQIIFILFFISPPIIAVLLFMIWRELKERNKMK